MVIRKLASVTAQKEVFIIPNPRILECFKRGDLEPAISTNGRQELIVKESISQMNVKFDS